MPIDAPQSVHLIDYAYSENSVFYHGTISDLNGTPKSTWTISTRDKKTDVDVPIDKDTFIFLWNGIQQFAVFKKSFVTGSNTKLDFYHFQVIGAVSDENGMNNIKSYTIAPNEGDAQYKTWIEKLHVPKVQN